MDTATVIKELRESVKMNRKEFSEHTGIPVRTLENSLDIAKDYVKTIDFADVTAAFDEMLENDWIDYCKKYLSEPHKGGDI